jgi:nitrogen-specific signal transduction histidine kinase
MKSEGKANTGGNGFKDRGSSMKNKSFEARTDNKSFISFLDKMNSALPESISGEDDGFMAEDQKSPLVLLQNGEPEISQSRERGNSFFDSEKKDNQLFSFLKNDELKPKESRKEGLPNEQGPSFMDSVLIELVHGIKNALASIYHATVLTMDKYDDVEMRERSHTQVREDIKKIDSVLNSVLNFISINTPILKTNTLYMILEEILEANEKQLRQKNIKIIKRYGKDLPDTFIHPEQVRFIFHSVLQYAVLSAAPNESIGFLMESSDVDNGTGAEKASLENNRRYIEVMIGFNGDGKSVSPSENLSETPGDPREGMIDLILRLAKEILQRNHGMMIETHGERLKTLIHLRFPVERRKVVYYEPVAL